MDTLNKNKGTLTIIIIFIVAMFVYNFFFKSSTITIPSEVLASSIGDDLVNMREKLQAVTLNQNIFSSIGFLLLIDFSSDIPQQPIGRPNPFNIIGRD